MWFAPSVCLFRRSRLSANPAACVSLPPVPCPHRIANAVRRCADFLNHLRRKPIISKPQIILAKEMVFVCGQNTGLFKGLPRRFMLYCPYYLFHNIIQSVITVIKVNWTDFFEIFGIYSILSAICISLQYRRFCRNTGGAFFHLAHSWQGYHTSQTAR